jgi:hypothetical protein
MRPAPSLGGIEHSSVKGERMSWKCVRLLVVAGLLVVGGAVSATEQDQKPATTDKPEAEAAPAPAEKPAAVQTVRCPEWVCEPVQCTRTAYRMESREESYTCTVNKMVPETTTVMRSYCVTVPTVETRTIMKAHVSCVPVTTMVRKCVDKGHYECREVPCEPRKHHLRNFLGHLCGRKNDCCEPCDPCCPPPTKIVKVWVPCPVWVETPVTCMKRVCEYKPETIQVTVCKTEVKQEPVQVTTYKCVPEQQTRTRTVCVCVPYQETYTVNKMVQRWVDRPVSGTGDCCESTSCCQPTCCEPAPCCGKSHRFAGLHWRASGCCH